MRPTPSPLYRPLALRACVGILLLDALVAVSILALVTSCTAPTVTHDGVALTNQALITATRVVHTSEVAATTLANALTAGYQNGTVPRDVLQQFQASYAPKISAALATAKAALQTWQTAPSQTAEVAAATALLNLARELEQLQGWFKSHALIPAGGVQ